MSFTVDAPSLSYALVKLVAPPEFRVESSTPADSGASLPLAIVSASAPTSVVNHRIEASAAFTIAVSCYSRDRSEAKRGCSDIFAGIVQSWRSGIRTEFGWISRVGNDSQHPVMVASEMEADDVYRFDCTLSVIARH